MTITAARTLNTEVFSHHLRMGSCLTPKEPPRKAAAANIGRPTRHGREAGRRLKPACKLKLTPQKEDQIRRMVGGGAGGDLSTRAGGSELASDRKIVDVSIASEGKDTAMVDVCAMVAGTSSWAHLGACL